MATKPGKENPMGVPRKVKDEKELGIFLVNDLQTPSTLKKSRW